MQILLLINTNAYEILAKESDKRCMKLLAAFINFMSIEITGCIRWTKWYTCNWRKTQNFWDQCAVSYGERNCCRMLATKSIKYGMVGSSCLLFISHCLLYLFIRKSNSVWWYKSLIKILVDLVVKRLHLLALHTTQS